MTPVQRLTGDFITSSEIGHLKKVGTVMHRSTTLSLTMVVDESGKREWNKTKSDIELRGLRGELR